MLICELIISAYPQINSVCDRAGRGEEKRTHPPFQKLLCEDKYPVTDSIIA